MSEHRRRPINKDLGFSPGFRGRRADKGPYLIVASKEVSGIEDIADDATTPQLVEDFSQQIPDPATQRSIVSD